jgi:hypothetical protein
MATTDQTADAATDAAPPSKALLRLVYVLGIILVLLFLGVIGGILYKINRRAEAPPLTGSVGLGLPPTTQIRDAQLSGDRLTINTGTEIIIVEVSTQRVILRVKTGAE